MKKIKEWFLHFVMCYRLKSIGIKYDNKFIYVRCRCYTINQCEIVMRLLDGEGWEPISEWKSNCFVAKRWYKKIAS